MKTIRVALGVALTVGALALSGCASSPDTSDLEAQLGEIAGVQGATVAIGHPGAPWNTEVVVRLFVEGPEDADLVGAVRNAAPVLADDPTTAEHGASIIFIDGRPGDYANSGEQLVDKVLPSSRVYDELGVDFGSGESVELTPDDLSRLATGS